MPGLALKTFPPLTPLFFSTTYLKTMSPCPIAGVSGQHGVEERTQAFGVRCAVNLGQLISLSYRSPGSKLWQLKSSSGRKRSAHFGDLLSCSETPAKDLDLASGERDGDILGLCPAGEEVRR